MSSARIVIVEDEAEIAELLLLHVTRSGYAGETFASGEVALKAIRRSPPDLVLLDLMLPGLDGLEVCRRLKSDELTSGVPVIMVTARGEDTDIVTGLELGAVDYVVKPFSPGVLMARVRNALRARREVGDPAREEGAVRTYASGLLTLDSDRHEVRVAGQPVALTITEFGILRFLLARPGFVRTRDQIIRALHGDARVLSARTIDVHITSLRRKLGDAGPLVRTVRGVGYRFEEISDESVA